MYVIHMISGNSRLNNRRSVEQTIASKQWKYAPSFTRHWLLRVDFTDTMG